ncbi:MAG: twin-arginine translocation signal domain-containing protein [Anaerolineales bacterium]|nr:twin-arginine translocation signal domain-containing protein [Anaerolineales bacterium]
MEEQHSLDDNLLPLSRREALKALAASSGALAAAAFLPARWTRPVVQAGVLPAHAQASQCLYDIHFDEGGRGQLDNEWWAQIFGGPEWDVPPTVCVTFGGEPAEILFITWLPTDGPPYNGASVHFFRSPGAEGYEVEVCFTFSDNCMVCATGEIIVNG